MEEPLELRQNNPYFFGTIVELPNKQELLESAPLKYTQSINDRHFQVVQGDTIWSIAHQAYGDSKYWWVIAKVNNIFDPFTLNMGDLLVIPELGNLLSNQDI